MLILDASKKKKKKREAASVTQFQRCKCATILKVFGLFSLPFHQIVVNLDFGSTSSSRRTVLSCFNEVLCPDFGKSVSCTWVLGYQCLFYFCALFPCNSSMQPKTIFFLAALYADHFFFILIMALKLPLALYLCSY